MKSGWMAAVVMIGAVAMVGCVSQKKYEEAMVDVRVGEFRIGADTYAEECLGAAS